MSNATSTRPQVDQPAWIVWLRDRFYDGWTFETISAATAADAFEIAREQMPGAVFASNPVERA